MFKQDIAEKYGKKLASCLVYLDKFIKRKADIQKKGTGQETALEVSELSSLTVAIEAILSKIHEYTRALQRWDIAYSDVIGIIRKYV